MTKKDKIKISKKKKVKPSKKSNNNNINNNKNINNISINIHGTKKRSSNKKNKVKKEEQIIQPYYYTPPQEIKNQQLYYRNYDYDAAKVRNEFQNPDIPSTSLNPSSQIHDIPNQTKLSTSATIPNESKYDNNDLFSFFPQPLKRHNSSSSSDSNKSYISALSDDIEPFEEQYEHFEDPDYKKKIKKVSEEFKNPDDEQLTSTNKDFNEQNILSGEENKIISQVENEKIKKEQYDNEKKERYQKIQNEIDEEKRKLTVMKNNKKRYDQIIDELENSTDDKIKKDNPLRTEVNKILLDFNVKNLSNMKDRNKIINHLKTHIDPINEIVIEQETITKDKRESLTRFPPNTSGNITRIKNDSNTTSSSSNPPIFV